MFTEKEYRYWLHGIPGLGAVRIGKLLEYYGSAEAVWHASEESLNQCNIVDERGVFLIREKEKNLIRQGVGHLEKAAEEYHNLSRKGIRFITPEDDQYPERLRNLYDPPAGLFVIGDVPDARTSAAIVGARNCSHYGEEMAYLLGRELCRRGVDVISGMALGIDGAAHRGVMDAIQKNTKLPCHGRTFAVLGNGVDICYPRSNSDIYQFLGGACGNGKVYPESNPEQCQKSPDGKKGGILSEFMPGTNAFASNFPIRNRIISGLADLVIVVEARFRSGSLITADLALEQGKDICAVPGRITDPLSRGTNELIRQGAEIITDPMEFVEKRFPAPYKIEETEKNEKIFLAMSEEKVYSCLDFNPTHLGTILQKTGLSVQEVSQSLKQLTDRGWIAETSKNYYALQVRRT